MVRIAIKAILLLLVLLVIAIVVLLNTGERLSTEAERAVIDVGRRPLPELIIGNTDYAHNNGVSIWYESIEPVGEKKGTVVLMMGAAGSAIFWPKHVLEKLAANGYQIIRYDYRGVGMSDWMTGWSKSTAYDLSDMSADVLAILDQLKVKKAHIVGVSMGGIIARHFVLTYPERSLSLTSISSIGPSFGTQGSNKPDLPVLQVIRNLLRHGIWSAEDEQVRFVLSIIELMNTGSDEPLDYYLFAEQAYYELRKRRGFNSQALGQHFHAIGLSASVLDDLTKSDIPVLVVHGTNDRVAPFSQAERFAEQLPNARLYSLDGIGHVFPRARMDGVIDRLLLHMSDAKHSQPADR